MAQPEVVLSVQVPEENEEENHAELDMDQDNEEPKVSLNVQDEPDEETQRTQYGLNSPKRKKKETDLEEEEEEEDDGTMTPATKLRQTAGINSPKQQKTMTWGNTEENDSNNALAGVITQVQQTTNPSPTGGAQSIITQVSRENPITPMNTVDAYTHEEEKTSDKTQQTSGGICSCLSALFTCCSSPSTTEQRAIQQINNQSQDNKVPKDPPPVASVDSTSNETTTQQEDKESSHSQESSTVYDSALLPPLSPENKGKRCLVLDLDETLVHSSFKPVSNCDFIIPVEIDGVVHRVYVLKRPYVDEFLLECSKSYELVIFTASLSKYADPLLDQLDVHNVIAHRLFRESCTLHGSAYVKDMRRLGRRLKDTIFVDNSPHSYAFQPKNAVPIASWFDDPADTQLRDFLPVLNTTLLQVKDVRHVLDAHNKRFSWLCRQANVDISKFES